MRTAKLKDITLTITDGKHGDCKNHDGSGYYFISCKDVYDETIHYENARQITEDDFRDADRRTNLAAYDILITNSGTIGRMALVKDIPETRKTTFQKSVAIVRADTSQVVPNYLYYLLKSKVHDFINSSNGSAQKNLLLSTMRDFDISFVDSFETQHRIATILSRYDSLIENYQKQIKLLEEAAQRLYKEWFVDLRFPGHENTNIVDGVPEGWDKKKVGEVIAKVPRSKQIPTKDYQNEGAIPIIDQSRDYIAGYTDDIESRVESNEPYIVFGDHTRILKYVPFPFAKGADGTQLIMSNNLDLMPQCLLFTSLVSVDLSNYSYARHFKYLKEEEILVPTASIANAFSKHVAKWYAKIQLNREQLRFLTEARDRLLPQLMSGEIEAKQQSIRT